MHEKVSPDLEPLEPNALETFDWLLYQQRPRRHHHASVVIGSMEYGRLSPEETTIPEQGSREYHAFKQWRKNALGRSALNASRSDNNEK